MATLVLSAVGTLVGGPIGGALGALAGQQLDRAIIGSPRREGPRLKELAVTTSSYGTPIARLHGRMRAPGSVIWATELAESSETSGGKGQPSVTAYSYSASFAVALSSRPIRDVGRIWADGNLLRGAAGDLKVGGTMRLYRGHGDHQPDPLIAADRGADCPAFRHTAYAVFEDLQLADFGNRIPALSFEVIADDGEVTLAQLLAPLPDPVDVMRSLPGLQGFSLEGGPMAETLAMLGALWPVSADAGGDRLTLRAADEIPSEPPLLPPPAVSPEGEGFGRISGTRSARLTGDAPIPDALRYHDVERDYLAGLQRADGRARPGRGIVTELAGALAAGDARALANAAAERAGWARESMSWRLPQLDPDLRPGMVVRAPGYPGNWRIEQWEWNEDGVELELVRLPRGPARQPVADAGQLLPPPDLIATPTVLEAFELPWDGIGAEGRPAIFAAVSSAGAGWRGAALYADHGGVLTPLGGSGTRRGIIGHAAEAIPPSPALLLEREASILLQLVSQDFALASVTAEALANGANRAVLGGEIIQFAQASHLGGGLWRIAGLLRGRGGTERQAQAGHATGARFVLLDGTPLALDPARLGPADATAITAIGRGDHIPAASAIANPGITLRPLAPVHPRARDLADGSLALGWTRRARGAWIWPDEIETPLVEPVEAWRVGLGPVAAPLLVWELALPALTIGAAEYASLRANYPGAEIWVRQAGGHALSDPLLLATLP